ncbi:MAG TPA: S46 family peptidase [Polyangiaceae bacterium]|nr:S46 family peptidase [Polyangiaceae bacterium]
MDSRALFLPLTALVLFAPTASADEGMWPFDMVPAQQIAQQHRVALTQEWLDHVRLASVRFNSGGSGSFVSEHGLVLTNHHVAADCIAKLASPGHDYLAVGYLAGKDGPEVKCPDLEVDQLLSISDVTAQVRAATTQGASDAESNRAMKARMASIEKECHDSTGQRCDVVTLYGGALYRLYRYRRYTDVRLVFAPEADIAFFGGDPDNFNYPRYDVDFALFRIYERQQALSPPEFLRWSPAGPAEGETVFTSGHPGRTSRDDTVAELDMLRDVVYPRQLEVRRALRASLDAWSATGPEAQRQARESIFGVENSLKAITGMEAGLRDPALVKTKQSQEKQLRAAVEANPEQRGKFGGLWETIGAVQKTYGSIYPRYQTLEGVAGTLLRIARHLVRLPAQRALSNTDRLPEYRETNLDELRSHVLSPAAIYPGVEAAFVEEWLVLLRKTLGEADPVVRQVLAGETPQRAAAAIVAQSKLFDLYARQALWDGSQAAVDASTDPLIVAMRALEPQAIAVRKQYDDSVEAPMRTLRTRIAEATFAVEGTRVAPDATFTLRLSVGVVRGYEISGRRVPWSTDFAGMYGHATGAEPLKLPERWLDARPRLPPKTPLNFVSTNDIVGGNSGSPVVNATGELVGLIFDGNLPSLPNQFVYQETTARAVSVDAAAMLEALRTVYGADALAQELARSPR